MHISKTCTVSTEKIPFQIEFYHVNRSFHKLANLDCLFPCEKMPLNLVQIFGNVHGILHYALSFTWLNVNWNKRAIVYQWKTSKESWRTSVMTSPNSEYSKYLKTQHLCSICVSYLSEKKTKSSQYSKTSTN